MDHIKHLKCVVCGRLYKEDEIMYTCLDCGFDGLVDVIYDYEKVAETFTKETLAQSREYSIWRYLDILPVVKDKKVLTPLQIGWTPLYTVDRLRDSLGMPNLFIKDDGRNPTASLKDRASSIGVAKALELGYGIITCASTGNAASSLAGVCASMGLKNYIFVPQRAPKAKVAQLLIYGATVFMVEGTYDQAFDLCREASLEYGWYNRNTGYNPYLLEGKKTAALEICEQLNWQMPDKVIVSVGDGCIISGLWKGFYDFQQLGFIDRIPQIIGVQAEGCCPLKCAVETGEFNYGEGYTIADSICVCIPRAACQATRSVREAKGFMLSVSDEEILEAMRVLGRRTGVFAEPAGVTGFAGLLQLVADGKIDKNEKVVVLVTGNGLKDVESAIKAAGSVIMIRPELNDLKRVIKEKDINY